MEARLLTQPAELSTIRTRIPARLDRLPWSRFHWTVIIGLGVVWILDGLEVTIVGFLAPTLVAPSSGIEFTDSDVALAQSLYVAGACLGALFFGQLTDRFGRKRLFLITLGLYLVATLATAASWTAWWFLGARFFTGAGIGGEYSAINSAIDELIPARTRGRVDLIINGSFWLGAVAGGLLSLILLEKSILPLDVGWRLSFGLGALLGLGILLVRRNVPESPRWLFIHGREEEAERIVGRIEESVREDTGREFEPAEDAITVEQRRRIPWRTIAREAFSTYPRRTVLGLSLFVGQAFIYNAVTITLGLALTTYFGVATNQVGLFYAAFAAGNFLGPLALGRLFDTVGRKPMIAATYLLSAAMLAAVALGYGACGSSSCEGRYGPWALTLALAVTFFVASAGASSAYLTVSEVFPMEIRALAIAFFYAIGTAIGGITGPQVFERLGSSGTSGVELAYFIGAGVTVLGGVAELLLGVPAERRQLEEVAEPITAREAESESVPPVEAGQPARPSARARRWALGPGWVSAAYLRPVGDEPPEWLDREVELIARALADRGSATRRELAALVGARYWGPGRFGRAVDAALARGRVRRLRRHRYAAVEPEPGGPAA